VGSAATQQRTILSGEKPAPIRAASSAIRILRNIRTHAITAASTQINPFRIVRKSILKARERQAMRVYPLKQHLDPHGRARFYMERREYLPSAHRLDAFDCAIVIKQASPVKIPDFFGCTITSSRAPAGTKNISVRAPNGTILPSRFSDCPTMRVLAMIEDT
jgi:hypothetical protein